MYGVSKTKEGGVYAPFFHLCAKCINIEKIYNRKCYKMALSEKDYEKINKKNWIYANLLKFLSKCSIINSINNVC